MWKVILSDGVWLCMLTNEPITSNKILVFLSKLDWWICDNKKFGYSNILLLVDNYSIWKSKGVKFFLIDLNWTKVYPPVYSPMYKSIENCFSLNQIILKENYKTENMKINLK